MKQLCSNGKCIINWPGVVEGGDCVCEDPAAVKPRASQMRGFLTGLIAGLFLAYMVLGAAYSAGHGAGKRAGYYDAYDSVDCTEQRI